MNIISSIQKRFPLMPLMYLIATVAICAQTVSEHGWGMRRVTAAGMILVGYGFWMLARVQLGRAFSLRPEASFLVTTGLYSKLRHPVYMFSIITFFGISLFFNHWLLYVVTVALIVLEVVRKRKEERLLVHTFGERYKTYQQITWL